MVFFDSFDHEKTVSGPGRETEAGTWYRIMAKGENSNLPLPEGFVIHSPAGGEQIELAAGDMLYPLDPQRFCKTSASLSAEQGAIEAGDDCDPGASILDGIVKVSGSVAGFFRYNDATGEFDSVTDEIVSRFFDTVQDDGEGGYGLTPYDETPAFLLVCLNSNAKIGQTENWLFLPVVFSSFSMNFGITDAQNKDLSWTKGEGPALIYKKTRTA